MTDDPSGGSASPQQDLDEPILELAAFQESPPERFAPKVIRSVRRRQLASDFLGLWWTGLAQALLEIIRLTMGLVGVGEHTEGSE